MGFCTSRVDMVCDHDYVNELTIGQKELINKARDGFLKKPEEISPNQTITSLIYATFYQRASHLEQHLFDFGILTLLDDRYSFEIVGEVQERNGGFRKYILDKVGKIVIDRHIKFRIKGVPLKVDYFKWKVKNDDTSPQPRGEITDHQTRNDPEHTQYKGNHFVECYALLNNVCVATARQNVVPSRIRFFDPTVKRIRMAAIRGDERTDGYLSSNAKIISDIMLLWMRKQTIPINYWCIRLFC